VDGLDLARERTTAMRREPARKRFARRAHSYLIAIDVAPKLGDYWRWRERGASRR
jgi:hypothetical protein